MDVFKTLILDTPDSLENISGVLPVVNGGTGADNASDARVNLLPDYTGNANKVLSLNGTATDVEWTSNGAGDVAGPASSTDNAVARFDSTTGKVIQNSGVTISDANLLTADALSINNNTTLGSSNTDTVDFNARIASEFTPATDNTYDLGRTGHEWRDLYLDGTANIDSLIADTADINGGTIDGTTIGATTPAAGTFSQVNSTGAIIATGAGSFGDDTDITGDLTVTGNVGVGTTVPSTFRTKVLEVADTNNAGIVVNGDATNAYASLRLTNSGTSGWDLNYNFPNAGDLGFFDIGAADTRMTLTAAGHLGIGTSAPADKLSLSTPSGTQTQLSLEQVGQGYWWQRVPASTNALAIGQGTGAGSEFMRITSTGLVGVGTTAPTAKFVVAGGGAAIQGNGFPTTGAGWEFYTDTTTGSWAQSYSRTSSAWLDANWNALTHKYSTSGAERMRITSGGDVFINGTTLNGTENSVGYSVGSASFRCSRNINTQANQIVFYSSDGAAGAIQTTGLTTAYNTSSDYRLKENVVPMSDALQRISKLKPSRFNFISDGKRIVDGFIAHEVQEVVPEAISGEKDAVREEEYEVTAAVLDDDGNEVTPAVMGTRSVPEYQGIDQSKLVPLLVGAIQELTARLEALENN